MGRKEVVLRGDSSEAVLEEVRRRTSRIFTIAYDCHQACCRSRISISMGRCSWSSST
jgi:hypothetical protein